MLKLSPDSGQYAITTDEDRLLEPRVTDSIISPATVTIINIPKKSSEIKVARLLQSSHFSISRDLFEQLADTSF